jgi:uncharacterized membrane-anchored protein
MKHWRTALIAIGLLAALAVANHAIFGHERTLREGRVLLLELAPVDPRSLMQGDYMALRFAAAEPIERALRPSSRTAGDLREPGRWGGSCGLNGCRTAYALFAVDRDGVGRFLRVQEAPQPLGAGEIAVRFRERNPEGIRIASNAWFFPEGQGARYEPARYGELRVAADGTALLSGLRDAQRKPL